MEVFSGNVLTEVLCHFETRFAEGSESDNLENSMSVNSMRACVAILNCAGKVDESKIEGLRTHIVGQLSATSDTPAEGSVRANLSPNVALLCAWGMTEDVAKCLASSISQYFMGDANEQNGSFTRKSGASRKRKSRGKKQAVTGQSDLPHLDVGVCLGILGDILKGSYPASVLAREYILGSDTAFDAIASALQTAKTAAERMIKPRKVDDAECSMKRLFLIGRSMECYGRLFMHKEATKGEIPMALSPEAKSLMNWVTDMLSKTVVRQDNALRDLDLSSIMSVESPVSSPISEEPLKKTNRISSPILGDLGDTSFFSGRSSLNIFEDMSKPPRVAAITATISTLYPLAEWLSLQFVGDAFVFGQVSKLCKLLECPDKAVRKALLPLLFYIAITNLKNMGDSGLFKEVLLAMRNVDPSPTEEDIITHAMAIVVSLRNEKMLRAAISSIVNAIQTIVVEVEEEESEIDLPFLDRVGSCMKNVMETILSEKQSSILLAQYLIDPAKASSVRESLLKELQLHSPKTKALNTILSKWEAENTTEDTSENIISIQKDLAPVAA